MISVDVYERLCGFYISKGIVITHLVYAITNIYLSIPFCHIWLYHVFVCREMVCKHHDLGKYGICGVLEVWESK